jgi:cobalt/nickel transport system ATP-binding protein
LAVSTPAVISVENLRYQYPEGQIALQGVSFEVAGGESVGLVGPNGAGKTTLFLCLSGVLVGQAKTLQVGGLDVSQADQRRRLPSRVGIVFQNSDDQLFNSSVFDDVAFGPLNLGLPAHEVRQRVTDALAEVGMTGHEERVPYHLSGGEKRRVALAGVLAMHPELLLLDEPSMYLDPRGRREAIHLINRLGGTKIIASHDLEMILQTCSRTLLLDHSKLVAAGPTRSILADAKLMDEHGLEVPLSLQRALQPKPPATAC